MFSATSSRQEVLYSVSCEVLYNISGSNESTLQKNQKMCNKAPASVILRTEV